MAAFLFCWPDSPPDSNHPAIKLQKVGYCAAAPLWLMYGYLHTACDVATSDGSQPLAHCLNAQVVNMQVGGAGLALIDKEEHGPQFGPDG